MVNYSINDFTQLSSGSRSEFILNKEVNIFSKAFTNEPLEIFVGWKQDINQSLNKINLYLQWLSGDCKNEFINSFCEIMSSFDEKISITSDYINNINWFENLETYKVTLFLSDDGWLGSRIYCIDQYKNNEILEINIHEYFIRMNYTERKYCKGFIKNLEIFEDDSDEINSEDGEFFELLHIGDRKKNQTNICEIHDCKMEKKEIKISYGLWNGGMPGYIDERKNNFPNSDDVIHGGCEYSEDSPKYEIKYICKKCNDLRDEWNSEHGSIIMFCQNYDIKNNLKVIVDEKITFLLKKQTFDNLNNKKLIYWWGKNISISNGKHKIVILDKNTKNILASTELELDNDFYCLRMEKNEINNSIFFQKGFH